MSSLQMGNLMEMGVTGDLIKTIIEEARQTYYANSGSIFAYAVWGICSDLGRYFEDEQGMPASEWDRINAAVRGPIAKLIQNCGLSTESAQSAGALIELLRAVHSLRLPQE